MIRFACPECGAVYAVEDAKAGKAARCPKCQARFEIPRPAAAPPPPPPAALPLPPPAPPPPADPAAAVEITPCPGCGVRLSVAATDLGRDVQCPYCERVYKAVQAGARPPAPPPRRAESDDPGGSGRGRRLRDEEDDRPSRRRRRDEDDDYDRRPRRRGRGAGGGSKSAPRIISGILSLLLGVMYLGCGVLVVVGSGFLLSLIGAIPNSGRDPQAAQNVKNVVGGLTVVFICCGLGVVLYSLLYFLAGVGALTRKGYGKVLTIICGVLSSLAGLVELLGVGGGVLSGEVGRAATNGVLLLLFVGHAVASFMAVFGPGKDEFD